jgi:hypothetical protein
MEWIMNATIGQLIGGGLGILFAISMFIEITPIKINPISDFLNWIGQRTNKELIARITELENKVSEISDKQERNEAKLEEQEAINCRIRILRFSDEIRRNIKHSQESFDQTLSDITKYEQYCKDHPEFENKKTVLANKRIQDAYDKCVSDNDFL